MRTKIIGAAVSLAVLAILIQSMVIGSSAAGTTVGLDVNTDGNTASGLGPIEECITVNSGESIDVDVWVKDVADLRGWEVYLAFDPAHVTVTAHDFNFFQPGGFNQFDSTPDTDGSHYISAASSQTDLPDGSGVLARYTLAVTGSGITELALRSPYPDLIAGVALNPGTDPLPIADKLGARIAIGTACTTPTPSPSPTPPPTASPTPPPTPSPAPTNPGATSSFTPRPTLAPTASPIPLPDLDPKDADCDGFLTELDVLRVLLAMAGFADPQPDCPAIGTIIHGGYLGDTDCIYGLSLGDIFTPLERVAGLPVDDC